MTTSTKRTIWLDYDDTIGGVLIAGKVQPGHRAYFDCIDRFVAVVNATGLDGEYARRRQQEIDMIAAKKVGFGDKTRFAQSMVEAYASVCEEAGEIVSPARSAQVYAIGMSVFTDYPYAPLEGVPQVLRALRPHFNLVVVTKGEQVEQDKKLDQSGLRPLVDEVVVMDHKSQEEWITKVFAPRGFHTAHDLRSTIAVGNSVKSDVNPPVLLGTNGVHLVDSGNWEFEKASYATPLPGRQLVAIEDMRDLPVVLASL